MLYNQKELPKVAYTAGKVTIVTVLAGVFVFMAGLALDITQDNLLSQVDAQNQAATTTLTVLNTPPEFGAEGAYEVPPSATTSPTNSGDQIVWNAVATDSNGAPYFLIVCENSNQPIAASSTGVLGTAAPSCDGGVQWAVSTGTLSGATSTAATTTTESVPFNELNDWYAWVCDDDPVSPRCSNVFSQGTTTSPGWPESASPFHVNSRPVFDAAANDGPVDPGVLLTFSSTSSDPDSVAGDDEIFMVVCQNGDGIDTTDVNNLTCNTGVTIATTTGPAFDDVEAIYDVPIPLRDTTYTAIAYLVDEHGHQSATTTINVDFTVNNVAPTVPNGLLLLQDASSTIVLTEPAGETTGFTLDFTLEDNNSCVNNSVDLDANPTGPYDIDTEWEIQDFVASVFFSASSTACDGSAGSYDPNTCYPSGVSTSTWNLNCTASSTSCTDGNDTSVEYNCTFPLWFVANPTDVSATTPLAFSSEEWQAGVAGIDDNNATGTTATSSIGKDLVSFTAIDILVADINYGEIEPGFDTGTLLATSTALNVGNTGLDQDVSGESMCPGFAIGTPCDDLATTSTIPANEQEFAATAGVTYGLGTDLATTSQELELDVLKTTSTSTPEEGTTYWGINVPGSITLAGAYTGLNSFLARTAEAVDWGF